MVAVVMWHVSPAEAEAEAEAEAGRHTTTTTTTTTAELEHCCRCTGGQRRCRRHFSLTALFERKFPPKLISSMSGGWRNVVEETRMGQ